MALNIDKTFRLVQFVSNKESRGWISPGEFNIAAELAQIAVYSRLESIFLSNKKIHNDMRPFLSMASASWNDPEHSFPANFRQLISSRITSSGVTIDELTQAEYNDAIDSEIIAPTTSYPACVVRNDGIHVYPSSIQEPITVEYIAKLSTTPTWNYTLNANRPVYATSGGILGDGNSYDFQFDDNLFLEIATLILANVGMNIKEEAVTQYAMAFNQQK
jgi:hypothetical protein